MKYLKISNEGLLDIRLVALMGGTTKGHDKYKIGRFGTGLKYTLAWLFRNNLDFKIFAGEREIKFHLETEVINDTPFEIICINGHRTSITTGMGLDWQAWMIVREIWCNALDEGSASWEVTQEVQAEPNKTIFYLQLDEKISAVIENWTKYFHQTIPPLFENSDLAIYPGGNSLCIYKNGVLVYEDPKWPALFAYDVKDANINELREYRETPAYGIVRCLAKANERVALYFYENVTESFYEGSNNMTFSWWQTWEPIWKQALNGRKLIHEEAKQRMLERGHDVSEFFCVPKSLFKELTSAFEDASGLMEIAAGVEFHEVTNVEGMGIVAQALNLLNSCNYRFNPELQFAFGYFENPDILARVHIKQKKVYVSNKLLKQNLFEVVTMLVEENEHFETGYVDESRAFQQHFINLYVRQLMVANGIEI